GRVVVLTLDLVVVGHLLAGLYRAGGLDEHPPLLDHRLAVGVAGVIEESRVIAVDTGIDDGPRVDDEEEGMSVVRILALVAPVGLRVRHALAEILDDAGALADAAQGEGAQSVYLGVSNLEQRLARHVRPPPAPKWRDDADSPRTRNPRSDSRKEREGAG